MDGHILFEYFVLCFYREEMGLHIVLRKFFFVHDSFVWLWQAAGRNESLLAQNMEKKARWKEEYRKQQEAALSEKAQWWTVTTETSIFPPSNKRVYSASFAPWPNMTEQQLMNIIDHNRLHLTDCLHSNLVLYLVKWSLSMFLNTKILHSYRGVSLPQLDGSNRSYISTSRTWFIVDCETDSLTLCFMKQLLCKWNNGRAAQTQDTEQ